MTKTEFSDMKIEKLTELLDKEYEKLCKKCKGFVSNIIEMELELESRCNI